MADNSKTRPPVVAIMGHVDHGKSTLLDYIRKSNIVANEDGGITQHINAYEVEITTDDQGSKKITFIDTPGHAAFTTMRECGASIADIAILIVSAEDSVKTQTVEAIKTIQNNKVPFIVAINKIDRPNSDINKVKTDLMEHGIYVEGFGGDVPWVAVSAKTGQGIDELLETILLLADLEEFYGEENTPASGFVLESHLDPKRGVSATLIIKNGALIVGDTVVAGNAITKVKLLEDFNGKQIKGATFSAPVNVIGFSDLPIAGSIFKSFKNKKEAEIELNKNTANTASLINIYGSQENFIPIIVKADTLGTLDATIGEIKKVCTEDFGFKIIKAGIGNINESDFKLARADQDTIMIGFQVDVDSKLKEIPEAQTMTIETFKIIYKLSEWLEDIYKNKKPVYDIETITGECKILKVFSQQKNKFVIGAKMTQGELKIADKVIIETSEKPIKGKIDSIEQAKTKLTSIKEGEFGMMLELDHEPKVNQLIKSIIIEKK